VIGKSAEIVNWRNIPISLKMPEKGEEKAHACDIAWFRKLALWRVWSMA
jgi:hypothetical protein